MPETGGEPSPTDDGVQGDGVQRGTGRKRGDHRRLLLVGGAMAAAVASWARAASACSCVFDPMVFPPAGSASIPLNWQLWGYSMDRDGSSGTPPTRLYGSEGEVPTRLRHLALSSEGGSNRADFPFLVPVEPLS